MKNSILGVVLAYSMGDGWKDATTAAIHYAEYLGRRIA